MKVAFFSNFLSHQHLPLCLGFKRLEDVEFTFVATEPFAQDRIKMGYSDMNKDYDFVLRAYEDQFKKQAEDLAVSCDLMIFGAAPLDYLQKRMQADKLTFVYTERPLKKGYWRRFIPRTRGKLNEHYLNYKDKPLYILCASAFTSYDLSLCGFNDKKCFKWGYFVDITKKDLQKLKDKKQSSPKLKILSAGRLLKLKRVMDFVKAVNIIVKSGEANIHLTVIGEGEQKPVIEKYIEKNNLQNYVTLLPFMKTNEVRDYMDSADVYAFGSDFREGWGTVINEAMNSGCVVVSSHSAGSVPFLIENCVDGFVYKCGKVNQIVEVLTKLQNQSLREEISLNAYKKISEEWTGEVAAKRLVESYKKIQANENPFYNDGICSHAKPLKNNWIKGKK